MGERYRKRMERISRPDAPWRQKPASEKQLAWLRRLCEEQDGEVDGAWLARLTAGEASEEIERRK